MKIELSLKLYDCVFNIDDIVEIKIGEGYIQGAIYDFSKDWIEINIDEHEVFRGYFKYIDWVKRIII